MVIKSIKVFAYFFILSITICVLVIDITTQYTGDAEVDVCVDIYHVVNGDTIDAFPIGRIRLADIDASELNIAENTG